MIELPDGVDPISGMTIDEQRVIDRTVDVWNAFRGLPDTNADDTQDARQAIHTIQRIIAARAMARLFPEIWT